MANDGGSAVSGDTSKTTNDASGEAQSQAGGAGTKTVLKPSSAQGFAKLNKLTTDGFKEVKDTIKEGFETMRDYFLEFGNKLAAAIGEKLDGRSLVSIPGQLDIDYAVCLKYQINHIRGEEIGQLPNNLG